MHNNGHVKNLVQELDNPTRTNCTTGTSSTLRTATAETPQFSALPRHAPVVVQQRERQQPTQEQHRWDLNGLLHSLHCESTSPLHNKRLEHSVDKLDLGHHPEEHLGLLEHGLQDHRDVDEREELNTKRC